MSKDVILETKELLSQSSNNLPLISVIIPAYNAAAFIERTLKSVINQTYSNIEVIVVDDGSQDETSTIVQSIIQKDARIRLFHQLNSGVAAARNLAIKYARGEFIAPIDADDIWYPQNLEKQVQRFQESDSSVGLVYAWSVVIDGKDEPSGDFHIAEYEGDVYIALLYRNFLGNASSTLIRRSCFDQVGLYDCEFKAKGCQGCEDWDLYLRITEHYQVRVVPEFLVGYRQTTSSMSHNYISMVNSQKSVLTLVQQKHPEIPHIIYRWSCSLFYIYMARKCSLAGKYSETLYCLYKALQLDFFMTLLRHDLYIQILKISLSLLITLIHFVFPYPVKYLISSKSSSNQPLKNNNVINIIKLKKFLPSKIYENFRINLLSKKLAIQKNRVTV
ncbi:glycosyltransferase family 2 protein [Anabaena subtropica]|uniref:Glycosyltransferase family 2 protein n=1 Tax=Anabaena subtropica FACHB-260 TaxID=2692884 RepID=A0ABR8CJ51_9NOST|nr:glycosyltransferase family A protein [Anabaena subtropica]MBD2343059.1 glycosyltransferase family 2 protein [Anabaena subtropica FACHB-260]